MDIQQLRRQVHLPGFFDQPPAGVGFMRKIRELRSFREVIKVIGQADGFVGARFVDEKRFRDRPAADIVKRLQHDVKPVPDRRLDKLPLRYLLLVKLLAGKDELTRTLYVEDLLRRFSEMRADMRAERQRQVFELHEAVFALYLIQRLRQRELVRGEVVSKKDHAAPVVFRRGIFLEKIHMLSCQGRRGRAAWVVKPVTGSHNK